jgi:hypothetical protein
MPALQGARDQAGEAPGSRRDPAGQLANENPIYALDGVPFWRPLPEAKKLYDASKPAKNCRSPRDQGPLHPYRRVIRRKRSVGGRPARHRWRAYSPATAKIAELIGTAGQIQQGTSGRHGWIESMSSGSTGYDTRPTKASRTTRHPGVDPKNGTGTSGVDASTPQGCRQGRCRRRHGRKSPRENDE